MIYKDFDTGEYFTKEELEKAYDQLEDEMEYEDFDEYLDSMLGQGRQKTGGLIEEDRYEVFWVGGERDGETLFEADNEADAINKALELSQEHEDEFDPQFGGIAIVDRLTNREVVDW